jgi:hypothetical protein
MSRQPRWRRAAVTTSLVALLGLTLSAVGVAQADEFQPANSAPTVSTPSLSASIQPDAGASDTVYSYSVVVGDADTLNDLSTVVVCLYHTTAGDATCATPDPATDVKLTWTQSSDAFTIDDGSANSYWALGSGADASSSPTLTGTSGTFTYKFTVSEATREGGWTAKVTADDGAATATDSTATTTVQHYSAITTRVSQDFGTVSSGLANGAASSASPTVTSNGQTTYSLTSGNFSDGTYTFTLKTTGLVSEGPAAGELTFDCHVGSTFAEASATRIGSTSTQISAAETPSGTPEGGSTVSNACRLAHGGQRPVSTYSFTVVNAVGNG